MAFSLCVCPDQDDSDTYLTLEALHIQLGVREKHMGKKKAVCPAFPSLLFLKLFSCLPEAVN